MRYTKKIASRATAGTQRGALAYQPLRILDSNSAKGKGRLNK
jgi:hypothetical protein